MLLENSACRYFMLSIYEMKTVRNGYQICIGEILNSSQFVGSLHLATAMFLKPNCLTFCSPTIWDVLNPIVHRIPQKGKSFFF